MDGCLNSMVLAVRSISEISSCFFGPRPWHIEIRHRAKKTSTINSFGFETLKLKIGRLKLWKPTVLWVSHTRRASQIPIKQTILAPVIWPPSRRSACKGPFCPCRVPFPREHLSGTRTGSDASRWGEKPLQPLCWRSMARLLILSQTTWA